MSERKSGWARVGRGVFWLVAGAASVAAIGIVALAAAVFATPDAWLIARADRALAEGGFRIASVGSIERRMLPSPGVLARDVRVEPAEGARTVGVAAIPAFEARIDLDALWRGRLAATDVALTDPTAAFRFEAAEGLAAAAEDRDGADTGLRAFAEVASRLRVQGATVDLTGPDGVAVARLEAVEARWTRRGPGSGELLVEGRLNGETATLSAEVEDGGGGAVAAMAEIAGPGVRFAFSGDVDPAAPSADGRISLHISEDRDLTRWLRAAAPAALAPLGRVDLDGALRADARSVAADLDGRAVFADRETRVSLRSAPVDAGAAEYALEIENAFLRVSATGTASLAEGDATFDLTGSARSADPGAAAAWLAPDADPGELARLSDLALAGSARLDAAGLDLSLSGSAQHRGAATTLYALVSGGPDWRDGGAVEVDAALGAVDLYAARLRGRIALDDDGPSAFEADLAVETEALTELRVWSGLPAIQTRIYGPARLSGRLLGDTDRALLDDGLLTLSSRPGGGDDAAALAEPGMIAWRETALSGRIALDRTGPRPRIEARIEGAAVDLTPFAPAGLGAASDGAWSDAPLTLGALELFDADVSASADRVEFGALRLGRTEGRIELSAGVLNLAVNRTTLYGGRLRAAAGLDASARPATWSIEATAAGVETGALLSALGVDGLIDGPVEGVIGVAASGDAPAEIAASLNGTARASLRRGRVLAIDLAETSAGGPIQFFGGVQPEPGVTPFDALTGSFIVRDGVARTGDVVFDGPVVRMVAEGLVDFGRRRLDLVATPTGFGRISLIDGVFARAFPVRVAGPWTAPAIVALEDQAVDDPTVLRGRRDRD